MRMPIKDFPHRIAVKDDTYLSNSGLKLGLDPFLALFEKFGSSDQIYMVQSYCLLFPLMFQSCFPFTE